jgi:hypothetical protein
VSAPGLTEQKNWPLAGAEAPAAAFLHLGKNNCNGNSNRKSQFVAEENIRLFVQFTGENNVGVFLLTLPDGLSIKEFQKKWHSFLTGVLRKIFPSGMWTRERQPRSGCWHCHAVVDMRRDIKTGFPFEEVARKDYRNVDRELRALWRLLRVKAKAYGFGWNTLEPIKTNGKVAAKYLAKYLSKAQSSNFRVGEERARLFGVWGRKRFVFHRFSWVSGRIFRRRLAWYAKEAGLEDVTDTRKLLGENWWLRIGQSLLRVVLPVEYYQVWDCNTKTYRWDDLGLRARCEDLNRYPHIPTDYRRERLSRFLFYVEDAKSWGMDAKRARAYARRQLERFGMGYQRTLPLAVVDCSLAYKGTLYDSRAPT